MYYARPVWYAIACVFDRETKIDEIDDNVVKPMTRLWNRRLLVVKSMTVFSAWHPHPHSITTLHTTNRWQCYEADDNAMKTMTMLWNRILLVVKSMTMFSAWHPHPHSITTPPPTPPPPPPHPILITRLIDDNVMKPMTMLWKRWQCYENDDNVMKTMTMLWNRILLVVKSMTMFSAWHPHPHSITTPPPHPPTPPHFNHTTNRWQCYEADDNAMKTMTMLWKRWQCYENDDNVMITMTMLRKRWQCYETEDNLSILQKLQ